MLHVQVNLIFHARDIIPMFFISSWRPCVGNIRDIEKVVQIVKTMFLCAVTQYNLLHINSHAQLNLASASVLT